MTEPVYPPWPPPSPRRFVWWEALLGLVGPSIVATAIALAVGFEKGLLAMALVTAAVCTWAGLRRRLTLLFAWLAGLVVMTAALVIIAATALFTSTSAFG